MNEAVQLPQAVYDDIVDHARAGHPEEICGIVRGVGLQATSSKRAENVAENRVIHYEVDTKTLLEFALHEDEMVGVYHSHPESPAYPSATDAWIAEYPNKIYFICSLEHFNNPEIRAFRMTTHYVDLDIPALREALPFYETRPNLFAYYQPDAEPPLALTELAAEVGLPFYIVYYSEDGQEYDSRIVQVAEHPIGIVTS